MGSNSAEDQVYALGQKFFDLSLHTSSIAKSKKTEDELVKPVRLRYSSLSEYAEIFEKLIQLESNYQKKVVESLEAENIEVRWDKSKINLVYFLPPKPEEHDMELNLGQRYLLLPDDADAYENSFTGELIQIPDVRVLQEADVICCTCVLAADCPMESINFTTVLIDECCQAVEPECLIPIARGPSRLILVGDHCQLGPVVQCPEALTAGFDRSLFERLYTLGAPFVRLETQYRMHPVLSQFPNRVFYENRIRTGLDALERVGSCRSFWPNPDKPTFFYVVCSEEQRARDGVSYLNVKEGQLVKEIIHRLNDLGVRRNAIGVIAPYAGQKTYLTRQLGELVEGPREKVEVSSVDGYQGREKDYIISSCVRSNRRRTVGFLQEPRRLNVALTRARFGLIVMGDPVTLSEDPLWNELLYFYYEQDLLVQGPLERLKPTMLRLSKPVIPYTYRPRTIWL